MEKRTSKREILTLWRASKLFEFIRQSGEEPDEALEELTLDSWSKYSPAAIVFGLDRLFTVLQQRLLNDANWEVVWRYADLKMRAFDENAETTEPVPPDVVAMMFKRDRDE